MYRDVPHYVQNTPMIASSGQPSRDQLGVIASDYDAVVNLAMPNHALAIADEGRVVSASGARYVHLPIPFENPGKEDAKIFCHIMRALRGKKVWVHCILNYRASAFLYLYFTGVEGLSEEQARSPIFDIWQPDTVWQQFLRLTSDQLDL